MAIMKIVSSVFVFSSLFFSGHARLSLIPSAAPAPAPGFGHRLAPSTAPVGSAAPTRKLMGFSEGAYSYSYRSVLPTPYPYYSRVYAPVPAPDPGPGGFTLAPSLAPEGLAAPTTRRLLFGNSTMSVNTTTTSPVLAPSPSVSSNTTLNTTTVSLVMAPSPTPSSPSPTLVPSPTVVSLPPASAPSPALSSPSLTPTPSPSSPSCYDFIDILDNSILEFLLNLEYLKAAFYSYSLNGTSTLEGVVLGGFVANFSDGAMLQNFADDSIQHIKIITSFLHTPFNTPLIELSRSFDGLLSETLGLTYFSPYVDDLSFLVGSFFLSDLSMNAYQSVLTFIGNKTILENVSAIFGEEGIQAGYLLSNLDALNGTMIKSDFPLTGNHKDHSMNFTDIKNVFENTFFPYGMSGTF